MRKLIFTYGAVSGVIIIGSTILGINAASGSDETEFTAWMGYLIMVVALSIVFVGVKRYRDTELGGVIKFGTAFLLGLGITVVASVIYVLAWEVNLAMTDYSFIDEYTASIIQARSAAGLAGVELEKLIQEMNTLKTQYANPFFRLPMTFVEIFPVGLIVSLLSAALLKNSRFLARKEVA